MGDEAPGQSRSDPGLDRRFAHLSAAAGATARILESLSKTSRAYRFYAPNNRALQAFVQELYDLFDDYFGVHLELTLKVRPEALLFATTDEEVYRDEDRETGFPFKLYRDGVRVLSLRRGLTHEEILRLQRILAMRTLGKLEEEDVATQLWRIRSKHVQFKQVRGFVDASQEVVEAPLEETDELENFTLSDLGSLDLDEPSQLTAPVGIEGGRWFDEWRPLEETAEGDEPGYQEIGEKLRAPFCSGVPFDTDAILAHVVTRALDAGLSGLPSAPRPGDLVPLLEEARYSHLVAGEVTPYRRVVKILHERLAALPTDHPWRVTLHGFLRDGGGRSTVRLLLGSIGQKSNDPRRVVPLLQSMEGIELPWLAEALGDVPAEAGRLDVARTVIYLLWPDQGSLAELASLCTAPALASVTRALLQREYADVLPLLLDVFPRAHTDTQVIIADAALGHASKEGLGRLARMAMESPVDTVRARGLRLTLRAGNPHLLKQVEALVEPAALMEMSRETAATALATWVQLPGREKLERLERGARPVRIGLSRKQEELRIRHMLALVELDTPRAHKLVLEWRGKGSRAYQEAIEDALERTGRDR
jgi:hypothetical protein